MKTTLDKASALVSSFITANIPVNLLGSPGVGKSDVIKSVAKEHELMVIDFRLSTADPTDLTGLPFISNGRSAFLPNEAFPIATDPIPKGYKGWLLFLDEITNAPMAVQAAAYKLILDRQVGQHDLHPEVRIVSAGNMLSDGAAVVGEMSTALKSRMAHINIELSKDAWMDWALENNVHHAITSFINFRPTFLYDFDPTRAADTFPCPRTWGMLDSVIQTIGMNSPQIMAMASATISDGAANEFVNYCQNFVLLPTYEDIVANPQTVKVPEEMSARYALSGSIGAQVKKEHIGPVMEFIERMPKEFQLRTFTDFTKRDKTLVVLAPVRAWLTANAKQLIRD